MINNKIIYLEGLPGSGKSRLLELLSESIRNIVPVAEILEEKNLSKFHNTNKQQFFLENDTAKYKKALHILNNEGIPVIDRSPLSTYIFNKIKSQKTNTPLNNEIEIWFQNIWHNIIHSSLIIYMEISPKSSLLRKNRYEDFGDPWSNIKDLTSARNYYFKYMSDYPNLFVCHNTTTQSIQQIYDNIINKIYG